MAGKGGSYPCQPRCECRRHKVGPSKRDKPTGGWDVRNRELASSAQLGTHRSFDGFFVDELKGYHNAHGAVAASRGAAKTYVCMCGVRAYCWGLRHRSIRDMKNVKRDPKLGFYSLDVNDYDPMCGSCHRRYDNG